MSNKISNERKALYYIGIGLIVLGVVLFLSSFFAINDGFEPFSDSGMPNFFKRALIGMICMIIGSVMTNIGAKGAAGSGLILNPDRARDDLKPYTSAAGGMINDVIENIDVIKDKKIAEEDREKTQIVKIKCRSCEELNDEDAKFCKSCGERM